MQRLKIKQQNKLIKIKNKFYIFHCLLIFTYCVLSFVSCSKSNRETKAQRIISLVPSVTEIIYALGQDSLLVGNTIYCDYPEAAKGVYKVGDFSNPSIERIVKRKPTLVFVTLPEQQKIVNELKKLKIPVFITHPKTVDSVLVEIENIGKLLNASATADSLVKSIRRRLEQIAQSNYNLLDSPRVYLEIAGTPIMTIGARSYINDLMRYAGARNVFSDIDREYIVTNSEELIERNPDIIIILHPQAKKEQVRKRLGWSQINAVKKNRIYDDLNPDYFFRPGPRFIYAIEDLSRIVQSVWVRKK
ncbi:MAG: cobalamin-binding protein [candidate division WOR-3 bacterium]